MVFYLDEMDILVIIYPNKLDPRLVVILDPYDKKVKQYPVSSLEEVKSILRDGLPFCSQNHPPFIHGGEAYVVDWMDLQTSRINIKKPEDIEKIIS